MIFSYEGKPGEGMTYQSYIKESHPLRSSFPEVYKIDVMAMKLVGERHEKRDLVNLVRWLIMDKAKTVWNDLLP